MTHTVTHAINNGVIVTDEHPASSYGIPVLVIDGQAYGDADVIESEWEGDETDAVYWVCTGLTIKKVISQTECRGNRTLYDFVTRGTGLPAYDAMMRELEEDANAFAALGLFKVN
jgi:hypothetical protein